MMHLSRQASRIMFILSAALLVAALISSALAVLTISQQPPSYTVLMSLGIALEMFMRQLGWAAIAFGLAAILDRMDRRLEN